MTDKKYTLTEVKNALGACLSIDPKDAKILAEMLDNVSITPDPSPSGDVAERVREILEPHLRGKETNVNGKWKPTLAVVTERIMDAIETEK